MDNINSSSLNTPSTRTKTIDTPMATNNAIVSPPTPLKTPSITSNDGDAESNIESANQTKQVEVDLYFLQCKSGEEQTPPLWSEIERKLSLMTESPEEDVFFVRNVYVSIQQPQNGSNQFAKKPDNKYVALLSKRFGDSLCDFGADDFYYVDDGKQISTSIISCQQYRLEKKHFASDEKQHNPFALYLSTQPAMFIPVKLIQGLLQKRIHQFRHLFEYKKGYEDDQEIPKCRIFETDKKSTMVFLDFDQEKLNNVEETVVKIRQLLFDSSWENTKDESKCARMTCNFGRYGKSVDDNQKTLNYSHIKKNNNGNANATKPYNQAVGTVNNPSPSIVNSHPLTIAKPSTISYANSIKTNRVITTNQAPLIMQTPQTVQQSTIHSAVADHHTVTTEWNNNNNQMGTMFPSELKFPPIQINGQYYAVTMMFTLMQPVNTNQSFQSGLISQQTQTHHFQPATMIPQHIPIYHPMYHDQQSFDNRYAYWDVNQNQSIMAPIQQSNQIYKPPMFMPAGSGPVSSTDTSGSIAAGGISSTPK
jgi:hypothetical protein